MAFTIENVESRTLLQQFHSLYENQQETQEQVDEIETDLADEIQDRANADADLQDEIDSLQSQLDSLGTVFTLKGSVATVADLPASNNNVGDIYYVISESVGYIWIDDNGTERWEQLGVTVDLSNYVTQTDLSTELAGKQDNLTAGTNISIIGNTISAQQPDTSKYDVLTGVTAPSTSTVGVVGQQYIDTVKNETYQCMAITDLGNDTFSYTWVLLGGTGKQNKLTAGTNISINGDVISASGGLSTVKASDIDSESATSGQVLTANGSGGASFGDVPAPSNVVTLDTTTQAFSGNKVLTMSDNKYIRLGDSSSSSPSLTFTKSSTRSTLELGQSLNAKTSIATNGITIKNSSNAQVDIGLGSIGYKTNGTQYYLYYPSKTGTFALITDITAKVPDAPDTDGTYVLKCVVSSGVKTYQWVLES